jgi:plasmid stabilization system protein ParE
MLYRVKYLKKAERDLEGILDYIALECDNQKAALRLVEGIHRRINFLKQFPEMFAAAAEPKLARKGYRNFACDGYVVIYRVDHKARKIYIVRVFYGKQDYSKHMKF